MRIFGSIQKVTEQEDGTLIVEGVASSESRDSDNEVITGAAMKAAIPDYMRFANVREMHDSKKAAGVALEVEVDDANVTNMKALIVDPIAVTKVKAGVYKGFSIGGRVKDRDKANKAIITSIELSEISLVDRPANPDAIFNVYKADGVDESADDTVQESDEEKIARAREGEQIEQPAVEVPAVASEEEAAALAADVAKAAADAFITVKIGGKEFVTKRQDDGTYAVIEDEDLAKGAYSIGQLARLAEDLECFANSRAYDAEYNGKATVIPDACRKLAGQLYDMLITMVAEDVAEAKSRLKAAKKSQDSDDLRKALSEVTDDPNSAELVLLRKEFDGPAHVLVNESFGKVIGSDAAISALNKLLEDAAEVCKSYEDLRNKFNAAPAAPKGSLMVTKGEDSQLETDASKVDNLPADPALRAQAIIKAQHNSGGKRIL